MTSVNLSNNTKLGSVFGNIYRTYRQVFNLQALNVTIFTWFSKDTYVNIVLKRIDQEDMRSQTGHTKDSFTNIDAASIITRPGDTIRLGYPHDCGFLRLLACLD